VSTREKDEAFLLLYKLSAGKRRRADEEVTLLDSLHGRRHLHKALAASVGNLSTCTTTVDCHLLAYH
jgi:hypothetical protein